MKILFITHETSRTGAPMVLLHFMKWLESNYKEIEVSVLAIQEGILKEEFKNVCTSFYSLNQINKSPKLTFFQKALRKLRVYKPVANKDLWLETFKNQNFDIIYSNTILAIPYGDKIRSQESQVKHVAHIHELNAIIKLFLPDFKKYITEIDHMIAASALVKTALVEQWFVTESKITPVYECSVVSSTQATELNRDVFHVGGSGTVHWRKGSDLFVQVALQIVKYNPDIEIKFTWVGVISEKERIIVEEDIKKAGLENIVTFIGESTNPGDMYQSFDVFLMTSREDPFPLVAIEAGMLGKPIICFQGATGTEEIIKNGGGKIVPYLDVNAMADEVINYYNHPETVKADGEFNKQAFSIFTPEQICPEYFEVLKKTITNG